MPCDYSKYPEDWDSIRSKILERARNRCELCGVPNGAIIQRCGECFMFAGTIFRASDGRRVKATANPITRSVFSRDTRIVLTVAHLDHNPGNCEDSNLVAYCQRCHLAYDLAEHRRHAAETRRRRREDAGQLRLEGVGP